MDKDKLHKDLVNTQWAIGKLWEGNKIRKSYWVHSYYLLFDRKSGLVFNSDGELAVRELLRELTALAQDMEWEIFNG